MFSTMNNQKKAEHLVAEARKAIAEADDRFAKAKERLHERIARTDDVRNRLARKALARFRELVAKIRNEEPVELAPVNELPFSEQLRPLAEKAEVEPVEIDDVRRGKGGALFSALLAALATLAAALAIGAVGAGLPLAPETFTQMPKIVRILEWLGGGAVAPSLSNPLFGAAGLLVAVVAAWMIAWSLSMGKAARKNLARAEAVHEKASNYAAERDRYAQLFETLGQELESMEKILDTCEVYMQEFNASLRRILHVEGEDYRGYKESSRQRVDRASACAQRLVPLLNIAILTTEGDPSSQLRHALNDGESLVAALVEEKRILPPAAEQTPREEENIVLVPPYRPQNDDAPETEEESASPAGEGAENGSKT